MPINTQPDFQGYVSNQDPRVQPNANPSSLQGTMTMPGANSSPTGSPPIGGQQSSPFALAQVMDAMKSKVQSNNALMTQRNLILKGIYDQPLSEEELGQLDPTFQDSMRNGDTNRLNMNLRLISDEINGRTNTLDQSVQFLTQAYNQEQTRIEKQKQDAISQVLNFAQVYGSSAKDAMTSLYGPEYVEQLKGLGIDLDKFSSMKTLEQIKDEKDGAGYDMDVFGNIYLSDKDIKAIDSSAEGKKLKALGELQRAAQTYKDLVAQHGIELYGANKSAMEAAYADLQVKWKEAAKLGALTGPDLQLIIDAVKPATGFRGITSLLSGGTGGITKSIDTLLSKGQEEATVAKDLISAKKPVYGNSLYLKELYSPFEDLSEFNPGETVEYNGQMYQVAEDGDTLIPLE